MAGTGEDGELSAPPKAPIIAESRRVDVEEFVPVDALLVQKMAGND